MSELNFEPYAAEAVFWLSESKEENEWKKIFAEFMESIAAKCEMAGAELIGHIKGLVLGEDKSYLKISVTSTARPADIEGSPGLKTDKTAMNLNVIVYGISFEHLDDIVKEAAGDLKKGLIESVKIKPVQKNHHPVNIQMDIGTNH